MRILTAQQPRKRRTLPAPEVAQIPLPEIPRELAAPSDSGSEPPSIPDAVIPMSGEARQRKLLVGAYQAAWGILGIIPALAWVRHTEAQATATIEMWASVFPGLLSRAEQLDVLKWLALGSVTMAPFIDNYAALRRTQADNATDHPR